MTPLQFRLTNTDTNYEFKAQSAGLYFADVTTGKTVVVYAPTGIAFFDSGTASATYASSSIVFYHAGTTNPLVRILAATRSGEPTGEVEVWNGQKWVNLNNLEAQMQVSLSNLETLIHANSQNIQTLWDAVFHN